MFSEKAKWITAGKACESPIFHGSFSVPEGTVKAEISICGLGFFELYLGGRKVSDDLLVPAWSDYEPRENRRLLYPLSDTFSHRIYYMEYDILPYLNAGENKLEVWLGNGWYNQHVRNVEGDLWYDAPKLAYTIKLTSKDGTTSEIHSDETLYWTKSPIVFNNVYVGETWDYCQRDLQEKHPVTVLPAPNSRLMRQTCPPDRVMDTRIPKQIGTVGEAKIYDVGENVTGYVRCTGKGDIVIRYSENLYEDGSLNTISASHSHVQKDEYHTDTERALYPKFSIKGFRYFEIIGEVSEIAVDVVHADVSVTSSFDSDNEMLNWLYKTYLRTQLNNMHHGIVSDCPHRERLGYTGDGQVTCNAAMLLLGSHDLFRKWIGDIMDCQDINPVMYSILRLSMAVAADPADGEVQWWLFRIPITCIPATAPFLPNAGSIWSSGLAIWKHTAKTVWLSGKRRTAGALATGALPKRSRFPNRWSTPIISSRRWR